MSLSKINSEQKRKLFKILQDNDSHWIDRENEKIISSQEDRDRFDRITEEVLQSPEAEALREHGQIENNDGFYDSVSELEPGELKQLLIESEK